MAIWPARPLFAAPQEKRLELIEYIREAQKLGLKETEIRQNALKAGWKAEALDQAFATLHAQHESGGKDSGKAALATAPSSAAAGQTPAQSAAVAGGNIPEGYRIGAGDVLQIMVWKEPDSSVPTAVVRPDGKIAMPLLKEVEVAGLTPKEAERRITDRLSAFIHGADVTVVVSAINSQKAYVIGAVKKEGPIDLRYRMSILQVLSEAGGLTDYAKRKKIYLIRTENGKQYRFPFNYDAVLKGEMMEQNIPVMPDDTIVVPH